MGCSVCKKNSMESTQSHKLCRMTESKGVEPIKNEDSIQIAVDL